MATTFECLVCGAVNGGAAARCEGCDVEFARVRDLTVQDYVRALSHRISRAKLPETDAAAKDRAAARALQAIPLTSNLGHMRALLSFAHRLRTHLEALGQDERAAVYRSKALATYGWIARHQPGDPFLRGYRVDYHPDGAEHVETQSQWPWAVAVGATMAVAAAWALLRR